jgi:hypothetical protein
MGNSFLVPRPWWQVGLTVLPGLIFLLGEMPPLSTYGYPGVVYLAWAVMVFLILSSILAAIRHRSLFQVPVWGLIPLGLLAGLGSLWIMDSLGFYPTCFLLAITGLLFARRNGLSASLFVLAGGIVTTSWAVEPVMYFWDSPFWRVFVNVGMTVLFTILAPILILRSRSILGQAAGLLFPIAAYSAAFVFALNNVRGIPISRGVSTAGPFIALCATVAIAAAVYGWISSRDFTADRAFR